MEVLVACQGEVRVLPRREDSRKQQPREEEEGEEAQDRRRRQTQKRGETPRPGVTKKASPDASTSSSSRCAGRAV